MTNTNYKDLMRLKPKQVKALELLNKNVSKRQTAKDLGISYQTIMRWCQDPDFATQLYKSKANNIDRYKKRANHLLTIMSESFEEVLKDPKNKNFAKVSELLLKTTGVLDKTPSYNIIVLNSREPIDQIYELRSKILELMNLLTPQQISILKTRKTLPVNSIDDS